METKIVEHPIRRKDRIISEEETRALLERCEYGSLASVDGEGQPYSTPLSFVYDGDSIYFHCALNGHKLSNIENNPKVSFSVVGATKPVYAKNFTTYYESAVIFGTAEEVTGAEEKTEILTLLAKKYLPEHMDKAPKDIANSLPVTRVFRIKITRLTGKAKKPRQPAV